MQEPSTESIELEGAPATSRAGSLFMLFAVLWAIVGQFVVVAAFRAFDMPDDGPLLLGAAFVVYLVVSFGPLVVGYIPRQVGRLLPFRWLLAATQPGVRLDPGGAELCTPEDGCRRFSWVEIASLEPDPAWLSATFVEASPTLDLKRPDGRVLMRVPASVYEELHPIGSRWRSGPRTLAERIVVMRPDRFTFADTNRDPLHHWFRLVDPLV